MDKTKEALRGEIFQLDAESQPWLPSEIEEHLRQSPHYQAWVAEVERRSREWDDSKGVDGEQLIRDLRSRIK